MPTKPFLVGAYASAPDVRENQEAYYNLLGLQSWIDGAEIPFPGNLIDEAQRSWLACTLPKHWHDNSITAIPGTMRHLGNDAVFGLASNDEGGRKRALDFFETLRSALLDFAELRGSNDVSYIEIHSAPTGGCNAEAFRRSIDELLAHEWAGSKFLVEHCDRYVDGRKPEKGFLSIEDEIDVCAQLGIGMTINWGRSSVEGRDALTPLKHVQKTVDANVLTGLMFSGAGPEATQYGYGWIDGHLPMSQDEPTSLMGSSEIYECANTALSGQSLEFLGAKVCVPKGSTLEERVVFLKHVQSRMSCF